MNTNNIINENDFEKKEQIKRGKRIKKIREEELHLNKSQLAQKLGISSQFLGLIEAGKGNLVYKALRKLKDLSGHSTDYILYGIDDNVIDKTSKLLKQYTESELLHTLNVIKEITTIIRNK